MTQSSDEESHPHHQKHRIPEALLEGLEPEEKKLAVRVLLAMRQLRRFSNKWRQATESVSSAAEVRRSKQALGGCIESMGTLLGKVISGEIAIGRDFSDEDPGRY